MYTNLQSRTCMPVSNVYKHEDTYDTKCKICEKMK